MRLVSDKAMVDFAADHREAERPLQIWRRIIESGSFPNFAELKKTFNPVDKVGDFFVVDLGGNRFRLITVIHFNRQLVWPRRLAN